MRQATIPSLFSTVVLALASACATAPVEPKGFGAAIEAAHGDRNLYEQPPLRSDVLVEFGEDPILDAHMTFEASSGRVRLDFADGGVAVFDGKDAWVAGLPSEEVAMARFHLLTWSYFLAAPWKLRDPGARMGPVVRRELGGALRDSARLEFAPGVGDTPEDWYVVYADPATLQLAALAYVVTFGRTLEEAATEPHAATYEEFQTLDGMILPTRLTFWNWSAAQGLFGDPIGRTQFTNLEFGAVDAARFQPPPGSKRVDVPR